LGAFFSLYCGEIASSRALLADFGEIIENFFALPLYINKAIVYNISHEQLKWRIVMQHTARASADIQLQKVYQILADLNTPEEIEAFLDDVCTRRELEQIALRSECAEYLMQGKTYNEIIAKTDISSTTLSRISRCIQHGSGGYARLLADFMKREEQGKDTTDEI
jgi:TrpR-related protein YerC/YecD